METYDDDLSRFEADGAAPLPVTHDQGHVEHDGARIWYAAYGSGPPVILLHGGLGHSGNWGYQVPALLEGGYCAVVIDSRDRKSTRLNSSHANISFAVFCLKNKLMRLPLVPES